MNSPEPVHWVALAVTIGIVLVMCAGVWALIHRGHQPGETREQRTERLGKNWITYILATQLLFPLVVGIAILLAWAISRLT